MLLSLCKTPGTYPLAYLSSNNTAGVKSPPYQSILDPRTDSRSLGLLQAPGGGRHRMGQTVVPKEACPEGCVPANTRTPVWPQGRLLHKGHQVNAGLVAQNDEGGRGWARKSSLSWRLLTERCYEMCLSALDSHPPLARPNSSWPLGAPHPPLTRPLRSAAWGCVSLEMDSRRVPGDVCGAAGTLRDCGAGTGPPKC